MPPDYLPDTIKLPTEPVINLLAEALAFGEPSNETVTALFASLSADPVKLTSGVLAEIDLRVARIRAAQAIVQTAAEERGTLEVQLRDLLRHAKGSDLATVQPVIRWNHDRLTAGATPVTTEELRSRVEWLEENLSARRGIRDV